jgi:hypothetical protein
MFVIVEPLRVVYIELTLMYIVYIHTKFSNLIQWLINYQQQSEGRICVSKYNKTIKHNLFVGVCVCFT